MVNASDTPRKRTLPILVHDDIEYTGGAAGADEDCADDFLYCISIAPDLQLLWTVQYAERCDFTFLRDYAKLRGVKIVVTVIGAVLYSLLQSPRPCCGPCGTLPCAPTLTSELYTATYQRWSRFVAYAIASAWTIDSFSRRHPTTARSARTFGSTGLLGTRPTRRCRRTQQTRG